MFDLVNHLSFDLWHCSLLTIIFNFMYNSTISCLTHFLLTHYGPSEVTGHTKLVVYVRNVLSGSVSASYFKQSKLYWNFFNLYLWSPGKLIVREDVQQRVLGTLFIIR